MSCTKRTFARYSIRTVRLTLCVYICLFCDVGKKCSMDVFQKHGRSKGRCCLSSLFANHQKQGEQHIEPAKASSEKTCSPIRHHQSEKARDQFCFGRERHQCCSRLVKLLTAADSTPAPEPSVKKIKLSLGAWTSLKKPKERPSSAQSPRNRLSAEIEQYLKYSYSYSYHWRSYEFLQGGRNYKFSGNWAWSSGRGQRNVVKRCGF